MKIQGEIFSNLNRQTLPYCVLLPNSYEDIERRFPVVYLLHGLFGEVGNWTELTDITRQAEKHDLIVVMPEGRDCWYTDGPTAKFESYVLDELIPEIESKFRINTARTGRAIAGLSMGGYGAFKFAAKRPKLFSFAVSFSGAFDVTRRCDEDPRSDWEILRPSVMRSFGEKGSRVRIENDLETILERVADDEVAELPFLYFDCGTEDAFLEANRRLSAALSARDIRHEFRALPGSHDWDYWSSRVPFLLSMATERLKTS